MREEQRGEADSCRGSFANVSCWCLRNRAISLSLLSAGLCGQLSICSMVYSQLSILKEGLSISPLFSQGCPLHCCAPQVQLPTGALPSTLHFACLCMGWGLHPVGPLLLQPCRKTQPERKFCLEVLGAPSQGRRAPTQWFCCLILTGVKAALAPMPNACTVLCCTAQHLGKEC